MNPCRSSRCCIGRGGRTKFGPTRRRCPACRGKLISSALRSAQATLPSSITGETPSPDGDPAVAADTELVVTAIPPVTTNAAPMASERHLCRWVLILCLSCRPAENLASRHEGQEPSCLCHEKVENENVLSCSRWCFHTTGRRGTNPRASSEHRTACTSAHRNACCRDG
jgi:hypothetical protein